MNAKFLIDLGKALRETPSAILEFTTVGVWSEKPERYDIALNGYLAQGYTVIELTDYMLSQSPYCYLTSRHNRLCLTSWQVGNSEQHWAFKSSEEAKIAVARARKMTEAFRDLGGSGTSDSNYWEVRFKHIATDINFAFVWRKTPIFPNLWKQD